MISTHLREARARYAANPSHPCREDQPQYPEVCLVTAMACAGSDYGKVQAIMRRLTGNLGLVQFNHEHTTEEVLAKFDEAISYAEAIEAEHDTSTYYTIPFDTIKENTNA